MDDYDGNEKYLINKLIYHASLIERFCYANRKELQWPSDVTSMVELDKEFEGVKPQKEAKRKSYIITAIWNKMVKNLINAAGENGDFVCITTVKEIVKDNDFHYEHVIILFNSSYW